MCQNVTDRKRIIGHDQDYPGSYAWPIYEILCPECEKWSEDYGEVDTQIDDNRWVPVCFACAKKMIDAGEFDDAIPITR